MPGPDSGMARRWRRAGRWILAAALWAGVAVALFAAAMLVVGGSTPAEARRKITAPETPPSFAASEMFGTAGKAFPPARNFAKWNGVLARYEHEKRLERADCKRGDCALVRWREFLGVIRRAPPMTQLKAVNDYLNRIPYVSDPDNYGTDDYWATPREFFAKGGDCEDYAIAKYLSLRALGWPADKLRVVVVHDRDRDLVHAALVAYHGGVGYVLDIEIPEVTDQRRIARYKPIFAIGENGWWSFDTAPTDTRPVAGREAVRAVRTDTEPALDPSERTEDIFAPGAK